MGAVATNARDAGGKVLGVMPHFLRDLEGVLDGIENRYTDNMHQRKQALLDEADGLIVLPGGIGTLEEAVETLSWAKLVAPPQADGVPRRRTTTGSPTSKLIDHMIEGGFLPESFLQLMADTSSPEAALDALHERRRSSLDRPSVCHPSSPTAISPPSITRAVSPPPVGRRSAVLQSGRLLVRRCTAASRR